MNVNVHQWWCMIFGNNLLYHFVFLTFCPISVEKLGAYDNEDLVVTLPDGMTITDLKWVSIWCRQAVVRFCCK